MRTPLCKTAKPRVQPETGRLGERLMPSVLASLARDSGAIEQDTGNPATGFAWQATQLRIHSRTSAGRPTHRATVRGAASLLIKVRVE